MLEVKLSLAQAKAVLTALEFVGDFPPPIDRSREDRDWPVALWQGHDGGRATLENIFGAEWVEASAAAENARIRFDAAIVRAENMAGRRPR